MGRKRKRKRTGGRPLAVASDRLEGEWSHCPGCGRDVKSRNLASHVQKKHHTTLQVRTHKRPMNLRLLAVAIAALVVVVAAAGYVIRAREGENGNDRSEDVIENPPFEPAPDNAQPEEPDEGAEPDDGADPTPDGDDGSPWYESYEPKRSQGSGDNDWWITYPTQHPRSGLAVDHPDWIVEELGEKPVVILLHSQGCIPCIEQGEDMNAVLDDYGDEVSYHDMMAVPDDNDTMEIFGTYDANDAQNYIPLTILVTLMEYGGGNVGVAWHSTEGATGEDWIRSYMKDAIYYHHESNAGAEG